MMESRAWVEQADGSWERMINGVTYLIDCEEGMFNLYRGLVWEKIDCASDFDTLAQAAMLREGVAQ